MLSILKVSITHILSFDIILYESTEEERNVFNKENDYVE